VALVNGDLVQVTDWQRYLDQTVLNVYYYRFQVISGGTNDIYSTLADWFEDNVIGPVADTQVNILNHELISVRNLTNGLDIFEKVIDVDGQVTPSTGQYAPSFVTWSYKLVRESLATRNGAKRYAGVPDELYAGNTPSISSTLTDAVEDALAADVVLGLVNTFEPIILKKPVGSPPFASYVYSSIGDAQFMGLGTQNTRKAGRGI